MGGNAFEIEVCAHDGVAVVALNCIFCSRVPGVHEINVIEHACAGHKLLGACAFLGRAAKVDDRTVFFIGNQVFFDSEGSGKCAGTQCAVAAAMSGSAFR